MRTCIRTLCAAACLAAIGAQANPIVLTHAGKGSGTLGGQSFSDAAFTITAWAETANRQSCGTDCFTLQHQSAQIAIEGLGTFTFSVPTVSFVNFGQVGFGRASGADLFNGPGGQPELATFSFSSSIGPVSGQGMLTQWSPTSFQPVLVSGGTLYFQDGFVPATFSAVLSPVPEPAVAAMAAAGLAVALIARRRSR